MHNAGAICKHAHAALESLRQLARWDPADGATHNERVLARAILYLVDDIYAHLSQLHDKGLG